MSVILSLQCDCVDSNGVDCPSKIHGAQELNLRDPMYYEVREDHGDLVIPYGEGLRQDLAAAALAAGWHWDGSEWRCAACARKAIVELGKAYDDLSYEDISEIVAHSMDV